MGENIAAFDKWIFPVSGVHRVVSCCRRGHSSSPLGQGEKVPSARVTFLPGKAKIRLTKTLPSCVKMMIPPFQADHIVGIQVMQEPEGKVHSMEAVGT